jgi:hypothetical protein
MLFHAVTARDRLQLKNQIMTFFRRAFFLSGTRQCGLTVVCCGRSSVATESLFQVFRSVSTRVARWYIFKSKIPIWVNIGRSFHGRCCNILWHLVYFNAIFVFYDHLVCFVVIRYIFPILVCCTKKNLATLVSTPRKNRMRF